ncbi:hypothetical protein MAR_038278 [Mya arenaria]|uniref:Uncharacterized protein n=1 Tax=Mya arenaria TaxID=6604 RepID=A0ABY7FTY2_MYAAR|nr:hypothetical protein MAR_038278 [Mya arenaria]
MSFQEEFCMTRENGGYRLIGFIDNDKVNKDITGLSCGKQEQKLATHVFQFLLIGLNGFHFPFFPVSQSKPNQVIFIFVWKAVQYLYVYGFTVTFVSMDGAQTNQDFLKMFCEKTIPSDEKFSTINIVSPSDKKITFIMDYSHESKMRNGLDETVLDKDMLYSMKYFQKINAGKKKSTVRMTHHLQLKKKTNLYQFKLETTSIYVSLVLKRVNSDEFENVFYQQRGNNTNPTFYQYLNDMNSVLLGQHTNFNAIEENDDYIKCQIGTN